MEPDFSHNGNCPLKEAKRTELRKPTGTPFSPRARVGRGGWAGRRAPPRPSVFGARAWGGVGGGVPRGSSHSRPRVPLGPEKTWKASVVELVGDCVFRFILNVPKWTRKSRSPQNIVLKGH